MKASMFRGDLSKALALASPAIATRVNALPVTYHVLVEAEGGRLMVRASNIMVGVTVYLQDEVSVDEEGAIAVPGATLIDLAREMPNGRVELRTVRGRVEVRAGRMTSTIKGLGADDFPNFPSADAPGQRHHVAAGALQDALQRVTFAVARDDRRPILSGVQFAFKDSRAGGQLTLAAQNGYRLAEHKLALLADKKTSPHKCVIPVAALEYLRKLLEDLDEEEPVTILFPEGRGRVLFDALGFQLWSVLMEEEGKFPDYQQLIPKEPTFRAVADVAELRLACRVADTLARENLHHGKLLVAPGSIMLASLAEQSDSARTEIDAEANLALEIGIDLQYLSDVLGAIGTGKISIEARSSSGAVRLAPVGDPNYQCVIMPLVL